MTEWHPGRDLPRWGWAAVPLLGLVVGVILLFAFAPGYLLHQGFPLDDAWIHAVYAREVARTGTLAYNPGVPATGETSPLWAIVIAWAHAVAPGVRGAVFLSKLTGLLLQLCTAVLLGAAVAQVVSSRTLAWGGAALVALHPDLIASAVSGMEVPLATLIVAGAVWATVRSRAIVLAGVGALAAAARPETIVLCGVLPLLFHGTRTERRKRAIAQSFSAIAGSLVSLGAIGVRNWYVSGMPLPATFYAKVHSNGLFDMSMQGRGFVELLGGIALVHWPTLLLVAFLLAVWALRQSTHAAALLGAALFVSGILFCMVSFALVPPVDPGAFYHQRYVLPALPALIVGLPLLGAGLTQHIKPNWAPVMNAVIISACATVIVLAAPARFRHLSSDATNIDDVQVAMGQALAKYPASDAAWVIDAGAARFFGHTFVVDMIGLNTPEMLRANAQAFLDAHPPRVLDAFEGWSRIEVPEGTRMPAQTFETTTPYTVTSAPWMRSHVLLTCESSGLAGRMIVRGRAYRFRCAP